MKPSVRSSAPIRLSSTMSEMRTVMIETIRRVTRNTPPITAPVATMSLAMLALAIGRSRVGEQGGHRGGTPRR